MMYVQIEKIYLAQLNMVVKPEIHHNQQALQGDWNYQLGVGHKALENNHYQVILALKAEYKQAEQVLAVLNIQQAGNLIIRDYTPQQLFHLLNIEVPCYLFVHLRQRVLSLTGHMGVKSFELPLLNFNQIGYQLLNQTKQRAALMQESKPPATSVASLEVEEETKAIVSARDGELRIMPMSLMPEVALGMTLVKMTKDTVNAGISWWKGERKEKKSAVFITREEQEAARASLAILQEQVKKLLQLNNLEEWCQNSLEDLAEKLQKAEKKEVLGKSHIEKLQADLDAIKDEYKLTDNIAHML